MWFPHKKKCCLILLLLFASQLRSQHFIFFNRAGFADTLKQPLPELSSQPLLLLAGTDTSASSGLRFMRDPGSHSFFSAARGPVRVLVDPIAEIQAGGLSGDNMFSRMAAGISVKGNYGPSFLLSSELYWVRERPALYMKEHISRSGTYPGMGKVTATGNEWINYRYISTVLSYRFSKELEIRAGKGRNFYGYGYRSLLLSDNSPTYPFFRLNTRIWKIRYSNLFAKFSNPLPGNRELFKFGAFHYLQLELGKRLSLGFFESVIWQQQDSSGSVRGFDLNYLNPVIFYRPVEYSRYSPDNSLMGVNLGFSVSEKGLLYGQRVLDDFNLAMTKKGSGFFQNKYGFQAGALFRDILNNLSIRGEFNTVRPYTYAHKSPLQNYSHLRDPLAHPIGANFREMLAIMSFRKKRVLAELRLSYAVYGADTGSSHYGKNIFASDFSADYLGFGNYTGQGILTKLIFADLNIRYLLNKPAGLMGIAGCLIRRSISDPADQSESYLYIGIRTDITRNHADF
jgi:hypothetical protein